MEEMYDILTRCQIKIQCCKPDEVDDWHLEAYICRLKTRLLYSAHVNAGQSLKEFKTFIIKLYGEICDLYSAKKNHSGVVNYETRIQKLTMMLKNLDSKLKHIAR